MKSIKSVKNLKGKIVLLRTDLNVQDIKDTFKLGKALPTIRFLRAKGAKVVIMSHRGRPVGKETALSLRPIVGFLKKELGCDITFFPHFDFEKIKSAVAVAPVKSIFLLENLRFDPGEDACDLIFAKGLASLGDIYVNDAFASHHPGASVTVLPKLLPHYLGLLFEEEVKQLTGIMKSARKPLVVILGGGKAADKFAVIEYLYSRTTTFLIGGVLANTFLKARGASVNNSVVADDLIELVKKYLGDKKIILPMDWLTDNGKILDLGSFSAALFAEIIAGAGTVIWNGPLGHLEDRRFAGGSIAIAKAMAKTKAFTVVGGGETTQLILELGLEKKIYFLSTGGGAMLALLAGKKLPALEALRN